VVKDNNVVPSKLNDLVKNKKTIRRYKGKKENIIQTKIKNISLPTTNKV
jgi:hypothetical protein